MVTVEVSERELEDVVNKLEEEGKMRHDNLRESLGMEQEKLQKCIRTLRYRDDVAITIDRKYEVIDNE